MIGKDQDNICKFRHYAINLLPLKNDINLNHSKKKLIINDMR